MDNKRKIYLSVVIALAAILAFCKIGQHDLNEWDESRDGVNAYEMLQHHDYVNLYYANQPDTSTLSG